MADNVSAAKTEDSTEQFIEILRRNYFENDEIIALVSDIEAFEQPLRARVIELCLSLAQKSAPLLPNVLRRIKKAAQALNSGEMNTWLANSIDILNSQGALRFTRFILKTSGKSLKAYQDPERVTFKEVAHTLEIYLKAISGRDLGISTDTEAYTDTQGVYFPPTLGRYAGMEQDILLYLLMAAYQWAQIALGTLTPDLHKFIDQNYPEEVPYDIDLLFKHFPEKNLAVDLYVLLEAFLIDSFLEKELPGLMKKAVELKCRVFEERPSLDGLNEKTAFVEGIYHYYLAGHTKGNGPAGLRETKEKILSLRKAKSTEEIIDALVALYEKAEKLNGEYSPQRPVFFLGTMKPERISHRLQARKEEAKKKIERAVRQLITSPERAGKSGAPGAATREEPVKADEEYLAIGGKLLGIGEEEKEYIRNSGGLSGWTLVRGSSLEKGSSYIPLDYLPIEGEAAAPEGEGARYDEWDYRNGDYKRQWCILYEHDIVPVDKPFVRDTIRNYKGYIAELKKRFALIKTGPELLRRQKEGEDIDIDAAVEAFSDLHAGVAMHDRFFLKLNKEERSIAALFLIDMSGSTKGWVNIAEKEALVLLCETLEALGDSYAVYGFSGTSRMKCDYYRIKKFNEPYSGEVKGRIAGITAKDYTRMGPPIRHSTVILKLVEARVKLLIIISDGRPEDWGAYRGEYGIEDTRKALIEAKGQGIHPFCITIDEEAGSYLPRMYGEVSYIVIDDPRDLPTKIMEIYRRIAF